MLVPVVAAPVRDQVSIALCKIFNPGSAGRCAAPATPQYKPTSCTLSVSTQNYDGTVGVEIVQVGKGVSIVRTTTVDNKGNETVSLTTVDNTKLGVSTGIGAGGNWGNKVNAGGNADVGADVKLGIGDTWTFTGNKRDAEGKADRFTRGILEETGIKSTEHTGAVGWLAGHAFDAVAGPNIPKSDVSRYELSVNGTASVTAGLGFGPKKAPSSKPPTTWRGRFNEKYDKRSSRGLNPGLNGGVSINGSAKAIVERYSSKNSSTCLVLRSGCCSCTAACPSGFLDCVHVVGRVAPSLRVRSQDPLPRRLPSDTVGATRISEGEHVPCAGPTGRWRGQRGVRWPGRTGGADPGCPGAHRRGAAAG